MIGKSLSALWRKMIVKPLRGSIKRATEQSTEEQYCQFSTV